MSTSNSLPGEAPGDFDSKMLVAKQKRKQAEHDRQLLLNRIALLKKEEDRACVPAASHMRGPESHGRARRYKKIHKTKSRAEEILRIRIEHERETAEREAKQRRELRRRQLEAEINMAQEEQSRKNRQAQISLIQQQKREDVHAVREEAARAREEIRVQRLNDVVEKQEKRAAIKQHEDEVKRRRAAERRDVLRANRRDYEDKVAREVEETAVREREVVRMERIEMNLIQKLKKTQIIQQQAFEDLEQALNGDLSQMAPTDQTR